MEIGKRIFSRDKGGNEMEIVLSNYHHMLNIIDEHLNLFLFCGNKWRDVYFQETNVG